MAFKVLVRTKAGASRWLADVVDSPTPKLGDILALELDGRPLKARVEMIGKGWDPPEPGFVEKVSATEID